VAFTHAIIQSPSNTVFIFLFLYLLQYSPSMRTTYLSMTDAQIRHFGTDFQV